MRPDKKNVILVGALAADTVNGIGGVRYACRSLVESPLTDQVNWILLDSTVPIATSLFKRAFLAATRIIRLLFMLITSPDVPTILIFGNYDLTSFLEKGTMIIISKVFGKRTLFSVRTEIRKYQYDRWFTPFRKWAFRNCDKVICQSRIAAKTLVDLGVCDPSQVTVIMNWVNARSYTPPTSHFPHQNDDTHDVTFLFVGHLTANKAPDTLVSAAMLLHERKYPFRVVICGQGPLREQLQDEILNSQLTSVVELRGWVVGEALLNALWSADVFVLPTHSEGMPNALLEAMAAGLPVITSPVSSIPEIVTEYENGLFVRPGDSVSLANAMEELLRSPELRREMEANNIARVLKNHTIDTAWQLIADLMVDARQ